MAVTHLATAQPQVEARETAQVLHRVGCPELVGRGDELAALDATLQEAADGRGATVLIGGHAGIGKTRLVDELADRASASGALVARGACVPIGGAGLPYGPIVGLVRDLTRQLGPASPLAPVAAALGIGDAEPAGRLAGDPTSIADDLSKTRFFGSTLARVSVLAEQHLTLLVIEDLQWADSATVDLLSFLARNLDRNRVLLVGTYRQDEVGRDHPLRPWLAELGRRPAAVHLTLDGLDRAELAQLLRAVLGRQPDEATVDSVWARSGGNPFFAEELAASLDGEGPPIELQAMLLQRVDRLSLDAQRVLRAVAVAGATTDHRLLASLGLLDAPELDVALDEAVDRQLLVVEPDGQGYRFRHELLRESVDAAILPGERARLHQQLATVLSADPVLGADGPGHRPAVLAAHWWAAGEWALALDALRDAAAAAAAIWAFPEALGHLERALMAMDRLPAGEAPVADRLALLEDAADAAYFSGAGRRSVELVQAAIDLADGASSSPAAVARYYTLLGRNTWAIGDSAAAFAAYRQARASIPVEPPSVELARILSEEARGLMLMSLFRQAEERSRAALTVAKAAGARAEEAHLLTTLGVCIGSLGHLDEGIALQRAALALGEELADPEVLDRAFANLSHLLLEAGRLDEVAALAFDGAASDEDVWGVRLNGASANATEALLRLGRHREAEALLAQAGERAASSCIVAPSLLRAMLAMRRGELEQARRLLVVTDEVTSASTDVRLRGVYDQQVAELALAEGRPEEAYRLVEGVLALAAGTDDETVRPELFVLAVRCLADGIEAGGVRWRRLDVDKARLLADGFDQEAVALVDGARQRGASPSPRTLAFTATCAAERSRLHQSDHDLWHAAALAWDTADEPHPASWCRWREAEARLRQRAGRSAAVEALQTAWRVSVDLEAEPLRSRIEDLARRARIPLVELTEEASTTTTVADDLGLTRREVEVLGQLAAGRTDRQIADALFISKKTASVHVSNILRKLDVDNRIEAGQIGQARGLA